MKTKIDIPSNSHDNGYVELISFHGNDRTPAQIARVSYGNELIEYSQEQDKKLRRYLIRNNHGSPLEFVEYVFRIKLPIFVMRQLVRHRHASINEISGRYTEFNEDDFFIPKDIRIPGSNSKQGSILPQWEEYEIPNGYQSIEQWNDGVQCEIHNTSIFSSESYSSLMHNSDVCKEQARMVLPQNMFTTIMWKINLRSLWNFLKLRTHEHAQKEIRDYANAIFELISQEEVTPEIAADIRNEIGLENHFRDVRNKLLDLKKKNQILTEEGKSTEEVRKLLNQLMIQLIRDTEFQSS